MPPGRPAEAQHRRTRIVLSVLAAHGSAGVPEHLLVLALGGDPASASDRRALALELAAPGDSRVLGIAEASGPGRRYLLRVVDHRLRAAFSDVERRELVRAAQASGLGQAFADLDATPRDAEPAPLDTALGVVQRAIEGRSLLTFEYAGRRRTVHPYDLQLKPVGWIMRGREIDGHVIRVFAVERAADLGMAHAGSAEPVPAALPPLLADPNLRRENAPVEVVLRHPPGPRSDLVGQLGVPTYRALPDDGSGLAGTVVTVTFLDAFLDRLLGLEQRVHVVGPALVRHALRERLAGVLAGRTSSLTDALPRQPGAFEVLASAAGAQTVASPTNNEAVSV